jgi:hypothetical protein
MSVVQSRQLRANLRMTLVVTQLQPQLSRRHSKMLGWLLVLWATSLAILNPLACFVYCNVLHAHQKDTHFQSTNFVCDMTASTYSQTFTQGHKSTLRLVPLAVYPGLGAMQAGFKVFFSHLRWVMTQPSPLESSVLFVTSPPPKIFCS